MVRVVRVRRCAPYHKKVSMSGWFRDRDVLEGKLGVNMYPTFWTDRSTLKLQHYKQRQSHVALRDVSV